MTVIILSNTDGNKTPYDAWFPNAEENIILFCPKEKEHTFMVLTPLNGNLIKTLCSRLLILCILQEISSLVFVEFDYYYSF
ncbi:ATP-grasp domain protein [Staphylococcus caprae]|nr:ATP-grasp domain protein [Staphylococcus caprae]